MIALSNPSSTNFWCARTVLMWWTSRLISFLLFLSSQIGVSQGTAQAQVLLPAPSSNQTLGQNPPQLGLDPRQPLCPAQLGAALDAIANRPQFQRARWGILVQTLSTKPQTFYARDSHRYFIPASNVKLLTTAAALRQLGPQFRYRTSVYRVKSRPNSTSLRVLGRGDPSLSDRQLGSLAQQLHRQGDRQVDRLILDSSYFRGATINPTWEWEDAQAAYGAPVNSLILNQNAVELQLFPQTVGQPLRLAWADPVEALQWSIENKAVTVRPQDAPESVTLSRDRGKPVLQIAGQLWVGSEPESVNLAVLDPVEHFARHFRQALRKNQIKVAQTTITSDPKPESGPEIAAVESASLVQLLAETNQASNNLYAESLLKTLGATRSHPTPTASTAAGLEAVKTTLTKLGVDPQGYVTVDGSGLSRHNLVSPATLVQTLIAMAETPQAAVYRNSLAVAGRSGTLKNRFQNTPAQGILQAKTGSMSGVSALSGYLNSPDQPLVFSILVNQSDQPGSELRQAIDEMALLLTRLRSC